MFKNYLKVTIRNLLKQKVYSTINVAGLAAGMTCCILIMLYVQNELSYDRHHDNGDRIYRVASDLKFGGNHFELAVAPAPMAKAMERDFPEVLRAGRFRRQGSFLVRKQTEEQNYKEPDVVFADPELLRIFTIPLVFGDENVALSEPNSLLLSQTASKKYFGDENPVGRILILDDAEAYKVTGVFEDMPQNSHFHFDLLLSMHGLEESRNNIWISNNFVTYIVLREGTEPDALQAKFPQWIAKYMAPQVQEILGSSLEELQKSGNRASYYLQPLHDIHLHSDLTAELEPNGNFTFVTIFSAIAIFILLIACVNFINLSTARSAKRAREVGIRKVVGSSKKQLIRQFLGESVVMSIIALVLAIGFVELLLPAFNDLSERTLTTSYLGNLPMLALLAVITIVVGIGAGSYPALVLANFRPVSVLKGKAGSGRKSTWLHSSLVVFQFAASIFLIAGTLVIRNQMDFIRNKSLGFNKEQVLVVHDAYALDSQLQSFKNDVLRHSNISSGTVSGYLPVQSNRSDTGFWPEGPRRDDNSVSMQIWNVDYDYIKTMGMQVISGRDFSREFGSDSSGIIINERAAALFGFENPIGERISMLGFNNGRIDPDNPITYEIIGIMQDFHFASLRENIGAAALRLGSNRGLISFRFTTLNIPELVDFVEQKWIEYGADQPFSYSFMDDRFYAMYRSEQKMGTILGIFSMIAISTACLGLFGLASFAAQERTKEIGIRKVLGAQVSGIVFMLSRQFLRFVLIAGLIAAPLAWLALENWLSHFAYRTQLGLGVFVGAIVITAIIALLTVSFQSVKAAFSDPVKALRYE